MCQRTLFCRPHTQECVSWSCRSNGKMGNGVPAKTSQEPRKPCQLNAKPASGAPLCAPSVQAEFQLDAVGLNSKAGQTAAARPLSKPADLAVTSKHPRTEGSRGHAVLLSRRTSSGLQPPSGSPKASLSFQLNFNTKAKPLLFAKSKLAAQPGQTTTSGQADMQRTQLLSSLKNISGGAGKSSAPSSLPFRFGTAPVSNGSKAPSQVTHTSPAPALPPQDRSQAENRPLTATAAAQHGVPHVTASTHDNLLAKQASSMTTHPMSKDITPTSPNLPNAVFSPPESSQLVSRATAKQSQKRQTEELPHVRSDSQNRAGGQDLPQGENAGGADQARTPWTTTSLAGDLMQNMKHLEAVGGQSRSTLAEDCCM